MCGLKVRLGIWKSIQNLKTALWRPVARDLYLCISNRNDKLNWRKRKSELRARREFSVFVRLTGVLWLRRRRAADLLAAGRELN